MLKDPEDRRDVKDQRQGTFRVTKWTNAMATKATAMTSTIVSGGTVKELEPEPGQEL